MAIFDPYVPIMQHRSTLLAGAAFCTMLLYTSMATAQVPGGYKSFGAAITPDGAMSTADFVQKMQSTDSLATKLECEIITSCTVKGCWMDVKMPDGSPMKVKFKDYGFFVPKKGLEGKKAVLQGYATRETLTVEMQRHYAEDAGKSKEEIARITEPKYTMFFLADGVLITE
jgi:hypothetical protein